MREPPRGHSSKSGPARPGAPILGTAFWKELAVYAVLVVVYVAVVLKTLDRPLAAVFHGSRVLYACTALGLILLQGAGLEWITRRLLAIFRKRR
jgi:hypothetical protein